MFRTFVEPCAGLANVSIRLQAGGSHRGPVGRLGSKHKYADAILRLLGMSPGDGADRYVWAEADPAVRSVIRAYPRPDVLTGASSMIERWVDTEDSLLLWDRLRHAGPITESTEEEVARWTTIAHSNRLINVSWSERDRRFSNTGAGGSTFGGPEFCSHISGAHNLRRMASIEWPEVLVLSDASECKPSGDPVRDAATTVFIDPPYQDTTGYGFSFSRRDVVRLALRWAASGAQVAISEAEPIHRLVNLGWRTTEISRQAAGSRTQFSKQQREFVTYNRRG